MDKNKKKCLTCMHCGQILLGETGSSRFKKDTSGYLYCSRKGMTVDPEYCCENYSKRRSTGL